MSNAYITFGTCSLAELWVGRNFGKRHMVGQLAAGSGQPGQMRRRMSDASLPRAATDLAPQLAAADLEPPHL